jgi:hypothetical protein
MVALNLDAVGARVRGRAARRGSRGRDERVDAHAGRGRRGVRAGCGAQRRPAAGAGRGRQRAAAADVGGGLTLPPLSVTIALLPLAAGSTPACS